MAVSPQELERFLDKEVDEFENYFDGKLNRETLYKGGSVCIDSPSGFNSKHFEILKKRYLEVGWSFLGYTSTQLGGDNVTFKY